jgi:hypothetical protein
MNDRKMKDRKMNGKTNILNVEKDGEDGLIVTFSDGTIAGYVVEELLELRPVREQAKTKKGEPPPQKQQRILLQECLLAETISLSAVPKDCNRRIH